MSVPPRRPGRPERPDATRVLPVVPAQPEQHDLPPGMSARRPPTAPRRRHWGWRLLGMLLVLALLVPFVLLGVLWLRIDKVDAMVDTPGARSAGTVYLLVGSDSRAGLTAAQRAEVQSDRTSGQRTDTILLLSVPAGGGRPALISVPRDSLVDVPGYGTRRINAAYAIGGAKLLVRTLQQATGVRIDDYVEIGFGGFVDVVGAVGTVRICLKQPFADERTRLDLTAGCHDLSPRTALSFVRARYGDPRSDLGRVERQRQFMAALTDRVASPAVLLSPWRLWQLAWSGGDALTIDRSTYPWDLLRFALAMRTISGGGGDRLTVPLGEVHNTVTWGAQADQLWAALRAGRSVPRDLVPSSGG